MRCFFVAIIQIAAETLMPIRMKLQKLNRLPTFVSLPFMIK